MRHGVAYPWQNHRGRIPGRTIPRTPIQHPSRLDQKKLPYRAESSRIHPKQRAIPRLRPIQAVRYVVERNLGHSATLAHLRSRATTKKLARTARQAIRALVRNRRNNLARSDTPEPEPLARNFLARTSHPLPEPFNPIAQPPTYGI